MSLQNLFETDEVELKSPYAEPGLSSGDEVFFDSRRNMVRTGQEIAELFSPKGVVQSNRSSVVKILVQDSFTLRIGEDSLFIQAGDVFSLHNLRFCEECETEKMHSDKDSTWFCPFCE